MLFLGQTEFADDRMLKAGAKRRRGLGTSPQAGFRAEALMEVFMLHTISPQDMREMERAFLDGTGYPSILLMEHAAQAVADAVERYAKRGSRVLFVCGSGNNGGDGCTAARIWMQRGGRAGRGFR